jgi:HAMP domain-containing protein
MVPLVAIRNEILILSLIIVLVIFIIAWFVAYGITRPLVRLKNAANFIALGNYDQRLEISAIDEIGELTSAFNAMSGRDQFSHKRT